MKISIVTTMYNSAAHLDEFTSRCRNTVTQLTDDYEFIFVNDGSPDDSLATALRLQEADPSITVIDLSRNFGHHQAIMTGLQHATGDPVFLIDSDLEESPELLLEFYDVYQREQADVVYGVKQKRSGSFFRQITGKVFYRTFNALAAHPIPSDLLTVRLLSWRYVQSLLSFTESVFIIAGLWALTGYKQIPVNVEHQYKGYSSYSLRHRLSHFVYGISAFSNRPLIYIGYLGFLLTTSASLFLIYLFARYFVFGYGVPGWMSVIVSVWFFGGLNIFVLGVIAVYISVMFEEVKHRPIAIVREIYRKE
jgi:putative glycosyltransferase